MDYDMLLDIVEIMAGLYLLYVTIRMKKTGTVFENMLLSRGLDLNKAPDPASYIKKVFWPGVISGILLFLSGLFSRIFTEAEFYGTVSVVCMFVSAAVIILYGFLSMVAQKKYLMQ